MRDLPISQAWNEAVAFVGREAGLLFPVAFVFIALPSIVLQFVMPEVQPGVEPPPGPWMFFMIPFVLGTLWGSLTISAMALRGGLSVGEAIATAGRRLPVLLAAALLLGLLGGLVMILASAIMALGNAALSAFAMLLLAGLFLFVGVRMVLFNPIAVNEPLGPMALLRRSWELTQGRFWKLLAFLVVVVIVSFVVTIAVSATIGIALTLVLGRPDESEIARLLLLIVSGLVSTVVSVFTLVTLARLYAQIAD